MKAKCSGVIAVSVHSSLATARLKFEKTLIEVSLLVFRLFYINPIMYSDYDIKLPAAFFHFNSVVEPGVVR